MSKAFVPSFKVANKATVKFSTNNPLGEDRKSLPVTIIDLDFNDITRSIEVTCSDNRKRQCRIDRIVNEADLKALNKRLQTAYDKETRVSFVAAGGNDPNVWFYTIVDSI